jgi:hypothetical protein
VNANIAAVGRWRSSHARDEEPAASRLEELDAFSVEVASRSLALLLPDHRDAPVPAPAGATQQEEERRV